MRQKEKVIPASGPITISSFDKNLNERRGEIKRALKVWENEKAKERIIKKKVLKKREQKNKTSGSKQ